MPDEDLNTKLQAYRKALEEEYEFERLQAGGDADPTKTAQTTYNQLVKAGPSAVLTLRMLSEGATSENVRASCSKFIVESLLGKNTIATPEDPMTLLLKQLAANDPE